MKPELRFLEFEENWSYKKLKDLLKVHSGRDYKHLEPGEIPVYGTGGYMLSVSDYLSNDDAIGIGRKGTINKPYLLKAPFWTVDTLFYCTPREEVDLYFLLSLFKKINWEKYDESTSVPSLSKINIEKLKVYSCELEEQRKIGDFFSKLDRQIELEEQKLEKLEEQKKGYMQKIFLQELRFKDENGNDYPDWIFEELNNIFTKYQNTIYLHDNEEYKRISISNKGKITHRDITFGKMIGRKRQYLIDLKKHPNTLTFIRQGVFLGGIGFIPSSLDGYIVTENMPLLSMSEEYSKKFMISLFSSESYYKSVIFKNLPTGSAQKALHEKDWLKSFVNIPVYSEQEKIGNFFEKQDNLIKKQSDKVELLKERKKGFLQKMFV